MLDLKPVQFTDDELSQLQQETQKQTRSQARPKSLDKNFPVFQHTAGRSGRIFVPDIALRDAEGNLVVDDEGNVVLNWDRALIHNMFTNKGGITRYESIRCVNGLTVGEYDGTCPMCKVTSICFDLANKRIEAECAKQGLDPSSTDEDVRRLKASYYRNNAVSTPNVYFTFPIVFIEKGAEGQAEATIYWYQTSEAMYKKTWLPAAAAYSNDEGPSSIAGHLFVYTNSADPTSPNAMRDAANNFSIQASPQTEAEKELRKKFPPEAFKEWTPAKSSQTVVRNLLFPLEGLTAITDDFMEQTRELLQLMDGGSKVGDSSGIIEPKAGSTQTPAIEAPLTDADSGDDMSGILNM